MAEFDGAGTMQYRYVHGSRVDNPLVSYQDGTVNSSNRRFLHSDHQGSIVAHSDNTGNRKQHNTYDEYGIPGDDNDGRFAYTGQINLPYSDLYHYKARVYHPRLGRFMQTDPVGYEDQINLYAYVHNDPLLYTDPTGEFAWLLVPMTIGAVSGALGNIAEQIVSGKEIDLGSVGKAAATGALTGALGGVATAFKALKTGGTVAQMIKNGKAIDKVDGINKNAVSKESLTDHAINAANSAIVGAAIGGGTGDGASGNAGSDGNSSSDSDENTTKDIRDDNK